MRRTAWLCAWILTAAAPLRAAPRLVVVISVDQMQAQFLNRPFTEGLKRLREEGAVFTEARHDHIPTDTGPGHSVILTGKRPGRTGVIGNYWWDRRLGKEMYTNVDSLYGKGPENMLAYTVGDALKAKDPLSKVVAVAGKDRAAIFMGGKRPDMAIWYSAYKAGFESSRYYGPLPAWVDELNVRNESRGKRFSAIGPADVAPAMATPDLDEVVYGLAMEAVERYDLGGDEHPDILAISFSATDYVGHQKGSQGTEMDAQLKNLDALLGRLIAGLKERTAGSLAIALTSDHGAYPWLAESLEGKKRKAKHVDGDKFASDFEMKLQREFPAPGRSWLMGHAGYYLPSVFLNKALAEEKGLGWGKFRDRAAALLDSFDEVAHVYQDEFDSGPYADAFKRSYYPGRSGDLTFLASQDVVFTWYTDIASHGSPYDYDARVPLVFWGADFKPGRYGGKAVVADIAPTLGALLGVEFPADEDSRAHTEILKGKP